MSDPVDGLAVLGAELGRWTARRLGDRGPGSVVAIDKPAIAVRAYWVDMRGWLGGTDRLAAVTALSDTDTLLVPRLLFAATGAVLWLAGGGDGVGQRVTLTARTQAGTVHRLTLLVTTTGPAATLLPVVLAFAETAPGVTSAAATVTLSNPGPEPLTVTDVSITGPFTVEHTCPSSLAAGQSCPLTLRFTPSEPGGQLGRLSVVTGAGVLSVPLDGIGSAEPPSPPAPPLPAARILNARIGPASAAPPAAAAIGCRIGNARLIADPVPPPAPPPSLPRLWIANAVLEVTGPPPPTATRIPTPEQFGGAGDGVTDNAAAIRAALDAAGVCYIPPGTYRIASTIVLRHGETLFGVGERSTLQARAEPFDPVALPTYPSTFNALEIVEGYCTVHDLRLVGGATAIKLIGSQGPCVRNRVHNVTIWDARIGIVFDGGNDPDWPCYWNSVAHCLVARPQIDGMLWTVTGLGDTPNANKVYDTRVYSLAAPMSGHGFHLSAARFQTSILDCEANVHTGAQSCLRLGAATDETLIVNFYAESLGAVPGIRIDGGSRASITNLFAATGGAPIWDPGSATPAESTHFQAVNAGSDYRNVLDHTLVRDIRLYGVQQDTEFVEDPAAGAYVPDLVRSGVHLVAATNAAVTVTLPDPATVNGRRALIKKTDLSANPVTVLAAAGTSPDGHPVTLRRPGDLIDIISNGAAWHIVTRQGTDPTQGWSATGSHYSRSLNTDTATAQDVAAALRALVLDLTDRGLLSA